MPSAVSIRIRRYDREDDGIRYWNPRLVRLFDSDELREVGPRIIRLPGSRNQGVIRKEEYDATNRVLERMELLFQY
jgi:hypothetical protein